MANHGLEHDKVGRFVHVCGYTFTRIWRPGLALSVFLPYFWKRGLSLNLELINLARLAYQEILKILLPPASQCWVTDVHGASFLCMWGSRL